MSEADVEVVRSMLAAFHAGDADKALSHFASDVLVDAATLRPDIGMGKGHEHLAAVVNSWMGSWEDWHDEVEEIRDLGSAILVISLQRGRGRGSGIEVEARYALLYSVRDDQITTMRMYGSKAEALKAFGMSE
jgi:ketosteroid isomerase-like protein